MNILNVLTVDDELPMREELENYPWTQWGCIHIGSCSNGEEALNFCRGYQIDIIISDVTMPVIDGIELSKLIKLEFPSTKIILLTCHDNFSYVKEALRLQVVDYILKIDLSPNSISQCIDRVRQEYKETKLLEQNKKNSLRYQLSKVIAINRLDQSFDYEQIEYFFKQLNYSIVNNGYGYFLFIDGKEHNWLFIQEEVSQFFQQQNILLEWFVIESGLYYVVFRTKAIDLIIKFINELKEYLTALTYLSIERVNLFVYALIIPTSIRHILMQVHQCPSIRDYHFYHPHDCIITDALITQCKLHTPLDQKEFLEFLNKQDIYSPELLDGIHSWALTHMLSSVDIKKLLITWLKNFCASYELIEPMLTKISSSRTIDEMLEYTSICLHLNTNKEMRYEIMKAVDLIRLNYAAPISLSSIAQQVGLSSPYLSKIFSETLGESFNEYLTRIRMEHADTLMKQSNKKIYEIAELVGIPNYRYFSKLYKRWKDQQL